MKMLPMYPISAINLLAVSAQNTTTATMMKRLDTLARAHPNITCDLLTTTYVGNVSESDAELKAKWPSGPELSRLIHTGLLSPLDKDVLPDSQCVGPLAFLNLAVEVLQPGAMVFSTWRRKPQEVEPMSVHGTKDSEGYLYYAVTEGATLGDILGSYEFREMLEIPADTMLWPFEENKTTALTLDSEPPNHLLLAIKKGSYDGDQYVYVHCLLKDKEFPVRAHLCGPDDLHLPAVERITTAEQDDDGYYYVGFDPEMELKDLMQKKEFLDLFNIPEDAVLTPSDQTGKTRLPDDTKLTNGLICRIGLVNDDKECYAPVHCRPAAELAAWYAANESARTAREDRAMASKVYGPVNPLTQFADYRVEEGTTVKALLADEEFRVCFDVTEATNVWVNGGEDLDSTLSTGDNVELYARDHENSEVLACLKIITMSKESLEKWKNQEVGVEYFRDYFFNGFVIGTIDAGERSFEEIHEEAKTATLIATAV